MAEVIERRLKRIETLLEKLLRQEQPLLSEKEFAEANRKNIKTIQNYVSAGKIKPSMYIIDECGKRWYKQSKLISNE